MTLVPKGLTVKVLHFAHTLCLCVQYDSHNQTALISLYSIHLIFCQVPAHCAVCHERTECLLYIAHINWSLKRANSIWSSLALWPSPCSVKLLTIVNKSLGLLAQFGTVQYKTGLHQSVVPLICRLSVITFNTEIIFTTRHSVTTECSEFTLDELNRYIWHGFEGTTSTYWLLFVMDAQDFV
jgi:hypothetical protein